MRVAYLDACSGLSGDMFLGAMLDAGLPLEVLERTMNALGLDNLHLETTKVKKVGITATKLNVHADEHHHEHEGHHHGHHHGRSAAELTGTIEAAELDDALKGSSVAIISKLAEAEAKIHGTTPEEIHFHEVGGLDTIVDIVGAVVGVRELGIERLYCSPLPLGHGYVECAHGLMPLPAPATLELLRGVPTVPLDVEGETVTPTGAVLAAMLADEFGPPPAFVVDRIGYGAGTADFDPLPNVVRLWLGEETAALDMGGLVVDHVVQLDVNVDDMTPELVPQAMQAMMEAGALDVWATPVTMKKGRPALQLSALAASADAEKVAEAMLAETTSFGVRMVAMERRCLQREHIEIATDYGAIRVKAGYLGSEVLTASPEYEDCRRAAEQHGVTLKEVYAAAQAAFRESRDRE